MCLNKNIKINVSFPFFLLQNHNSIFGIREAGLWTGRRKTELFTSLNLHTERLVSFLQTTACEVLQGVHVLKKKKEKILPGDKYKSK